MELHIICLSAGFICGNKRAAKQKCRIGEVKERELELYLHIIAGEARKIVADYSGNAKQM